MFKWLRKWRKRDDGSAAIEFVLLTLPLYTLILGIVETSLYFTSGMVLEGASAEAGRLIRTGAVQLAADPQDMFEEALCDNAVAMLDCSKLQYEVIHVSPNTFGNAENYESEFDDDGNLIPGPFETGNSNDVVLIRTAYRYEFLTPFLGAMMTGDPEKNWKMHISTVVLKAEPYDFGEE